MADNVFEVHGLNELIARFRSFPQKLKQLEGLGMRASLHVLWENVPSYPAKPDTSDYRRTGTLGRSLGSSQSGGISGGQPNIYEVNGLGSSTVEGRFGTNVVYAEYVIGENQARHMTHWWKLSSILGKSREKLLKVWNNIASQMARFLDGGGI